MNVNEQFRYLNVGLPDRIQRKKIYGDFPGAIALIDQTLAEGKGSRGFRACLQVQREMISRLAADYPYTFEDAVALARSHAPDFTAQELRDLEAQGRVDWIYVDGVPHYFEDFFETLCETDPAYAVRAGRKKDPGESASLLRRRRLFTELKEQGSTARRITVKATVKLHDDVFRPGQRVLVHLPVAALCQEQSDIRIEGIFPANGLVDREDAPQRTVAWEEVMEENHPFQVEYSYTYRNTYVDPWNAAADPVQPDFDTEELQPHIVFTPYIRDLVSELTAGTEDALEKARQFYDFVTKNVKYGFSRAYFGLESIAETCARNLVGDCGIQAILFITLCRCAGIPARWESGLTAGPDRCGCHDWAKIYVAPLGWFPVDLSRGGDAYAQGDEFVRRCYFGNLEGDRMVANSQLQAPFGLPKNHYRADPYDNQSGEIELEDRGLRYSEFDNTKQVTAYEVL